MGYSTFTYKYFSTELGKEFTLELSKENCPEEVIAFIQEDDHRIELQDRYDSEHESYSFQRRMQKAQEDDSDFEDPITQIPSHYDQAETDYDESETRRQCEEELRSHLKDLTPAQQELYARVNFDKVPQADIAKEDGVSRAAVFNRFAKINERLTRLCRKDI